MPDLSVRLKETVHKGIQWVISSLEPDGSFRGCPTELAAYYKSLYALAVCGEIEPGMRSLGYLRSHLRNPDGELASGEAKTSITRMQANLANYMDGWIAIGAWLLGDYTLAEDVSKHLHDQQCVQHGGVLTGPIKWSGRPRYDLSTAASCGRAFLLVGHRRSAMDAADFIVHALEHQSNPSQWLDLSFDDIWNPIDAPSTDVSSYYRFDLSKKGEKVWFPAFCSAFLCEIFFITNNNNYLEAAKKYYSYISSCHEFKAGTLANGKSGWASGLLAQATGNPEYIDAFARIVPNVLSRQLENGEFIESPTAKKAPSPAAVPEQKGKVESPVDLGRRLERTAEFTIWSAEFLRMVSNGLMPPTSREPVE